jgi:hypothetical protein
MNRKLAQRNMVMGVSMFLVIIGLLGFCFVWAALYLSFIH